MHQHTDYPEMSHDQSQKKARSWNFGFRKKRNCTVQVGKTKPLITFAITVKMVCTFVFTQVKIQFSYDEAEMQIPVLEQLSTYRSVSWKVFPRLVFITYCHMLISSVLVVLSPVGCLWIISV